MSNDELLYISASPHAIDVSLVTKDIALIEYSKDENENINNIAAIGDGANDLPFLSISNLSVIGCPCNSQEKVKEYVRSKHNQFVSHKSDIDGFLEFYDICKNRKVSSIFSDRDGVLIGQAYNKEAVRKLLGVLDRTLARDNPAIKILTGSSVEQNYDFINKYRLNTLSTEIDPFLIFAENGAIKINIFDYSLRKSLIINSNFLEWFKKNLERFILNDVSNFISKKYNLELTEMAIKPNAMYIPKKETMTTIDLPKLDSTSLVKVSNEFLAQEIIYIIKDNLEKHNIRYKIL